MFTPLNEAQDERLKFEDHEVTTVSGNRSQRGPGVHAVVEIAGAQYEVHGLPCGLPNCYCDAYLKRLWPEKSRQHRMHNVKEDVK